MVEPPNKPSNRLYRLGLDRRQLFALLAALLLVASGTLGTVRLIQDRVEAMIAESLRTILEQADQAVGFSVRDRRLAAASLAQSPPVIAAIEDLLDLPPQRAALLAAPAQTQLHRLIEAALPQGHHQDFVILGPGNSAIAAAYTSDVGGIDPLADEPDALARLWSGQAAFSPARTSDDQPSAAKPHPRTRDVGYVLVGAPVSDATGRPIALLVLRFDPRADLLPLLRQGPGRTGEIYAFDRNGRLLIDGHAGDDLHHAGRLGNGHSAGHVHRIDPGAKPKAPPRQASGEPAPTAAPSPPTRMAANAAAGRSGIDIAGYRGSRGTPVVGAWTWNEALGIGLAIEQERTEAYGVFVLVRTLVYIAGAATAFVVVALALILTRERRRLRAAESRLAAIVETAIDGMILIDARGRIENVNPALGQIFGYSAEQLLGQSVNMLMPEPHRSRHDDYIQRYLETGITQIIGTNRETLAQRADGSRFPIELSVNRLDLDSGPHFAGVIRDISQRRLAEERLAAEQRFTGLVIDALAAHIAVLDETGRIVFVNRAWRDFATANGLESGDATLGQNYLEIVERSNGESAAETPLVAERLRGLLAGALESFSVEYSCHSPDTRRWFQLRATRFLHEGRPSIVIAHADITARVEAEKTLKREKEAAETANSMLQLTRTALERTEIGEFWVNTRDGGILHVNDHACRQLGYRREELMRLRVPDFAPEFPPEAFQQDVVAAVRARGWDRIESVHRTKDGRAVPVEVIVMYREMGAGEDDMLVAFAIDIAERKAAEAALVRAREEAEAANRAKSVFLATMSHEIRTPLNGIVGTIDVLGYTVLDQYQRDLLQTARESAFTLTGIIDDILDFSKIEAGRLELEAVPLSLESLIEGIGQTLQPVAQDRGVELLLYCDPALPELVGDPVRLKQVLFNLAGNAIKFSGGSPDREGRVVVSAALEQSEQGSAHCRLEVRDNGIGMSPDVQRRLFQPFVQGEGTTTRRFGGTGLGLVISRRLIEMMGGQVQVQSEEGRGSVFTVHLALATTAAPTAPPTTELTGLHVLLVARDDQASDILERYLERAGADVTRAAPLEALARLREVHATPGTLIVVIDGQGERAAAEDLRGRLRAQAEGDALRFVLIGRGRRRYARRDGDDSMALDLNAMRRATFVNAVAAVVGRESPELAEPGEAHPPALAPPTLAEAERSDRLILLVEDNPYNQRVIGQQLNLLGYAVETAEDGREALPLWRTGRFALVLTDCHMPEMDGYELTRAIRAEEGAEGDGGRHTPIVAITADAMKGTEASCRAAGMDDYLAKPIQLHQLRGLIGKWLPASPEVSAKEVPDAEEATREAEGKGEAIDRQALPNLLGPVEPAELVDYYQLFIDSCDETAAELLAAQAAGEIEEIARLGHRLKSAARTAGAQALANCCLALETAAKTSDRPAIDREMGRFAPLVEEVRAWVANHGAEVAQTEDSDGRPRARSPSP
ncbi:PAS domain S-box [Thioflavicoccus mobilis 8321]|uniref:Sensor protein FixL n=1 Tax=Thioflavicoccus mobilis 8321 TaxID=765912 RepID=L0H338_9GAMM|nr:PAS domain S-box protein [Thioflavicoccus mobilis]AGA92070.1 PAS domain S-box [Thioflavicoccus mobilis 8321]